jgi:hypothetical protein
MTQREHCFRDGHLPTVAGLHNTVSATRYERRSNLPYEAIIIIGTSHLFGSKQAFDIEQES